MPKSDNRSKLVEDNLKLVHYIINKEFPTFRGDEDIFQSGALGLSQAALKWEEPKGAFSTFAYSCIRNGIMQELRSRYKQVPTISLDVSVEDNITLEDVLGGGEDTDITEISVDTFTKTLTNDERVVFNLKASGHKLKEIEEITGYHHSMVRSILRKIRQKYLKLR
jgi:RNA polymerase sigma factor (sigma-70 family)